MFIDDRAFQLLTHKLFLILRPGRILQFKDVGKEVIQLKELNDHAIESEFW
jgi:hypothetical protein